MNRDELLAKHKCEAVLDGGHVRLIDVMGDDERIEQVARVSFDGRGRSERRSLLRYLMRHRHTSPFEHACITLDIRAPIFVARQIMRHRMQSINEVSARYTELPADGYRPDLEQVCEQSATNRQGRGAPLDADMAQQWLDANTSASSTSADLYRWACAAGVSRELARITLPVSTYTRWVSTWDAHNLMHFLALRLDHHAQWEVRQYAEAIAAIVADWLPITWQAFSDYRLRAATLSSAELVALRSSITPDILDSVCKLSAAYGSSEREISDLRMLLWGAP
jgi:thymidylate synthase (FAD)